jgi:hypothetical protein
LVLLLGCLKAHLLRVGEKVMHDFSHLVYLDLHKTGSSFVSKFLQDCCLLNEVKFHKHAWIKDDYEANKFYFITIRHPVSLYSSLYRFGLDGLGDVRNRFARSGKLAAYSSFNSFVEFCLDERNSSLLGYGYNDIYAHHIGFMSFRFLKLSLQFPHKKINFFLENNLDIEGLEKLFITNLEIKNEDLNSRLVDLSTKRLPDYFKQEAVGEFFQNPPKINSSKTNVASIGTLSKAVYSKLQRKEKLLLSRY